MARESGFQSMAALVISFLSECLLTNLHHFCGFAHVFLIRAEFFAMACLFYKTIFRTYGTLRCERTNYQSNIWTMERHYSFHRSFLKMCKSRRKESHFG